MMKAAFILIYVATLTHLSRAEPPLNIIGEGLMSNPAAQSGKGVRYAGPIVYSNEKPPIIYFPPPPKNAKPGFGGHPFGKSKSPKAIKYVPMPHHDLPVLIYTSDKMPPIHVVQPPNGPTNFPPQDFSPIKTESEIVSSGPFKPAGSLSSVYGTLGESTSSRILNPDRYRIPSTPYGNPVQPFGVPMGPIWPSRPISNIDTDSGASFQQTVKDTMPSVSFNSQKQQPPTPEPVPNSYKPVFGTTYPKKSPHVMYSGHPPIHIFNEPDMFVKAPREIPLKTFDEMPPMASFGPPKSSFGSSPIINSFGGNPSYAYRPPVASFGPPVPSHRPSQFSFGPRENLLTSASVQRPSTFASFKPQSEAPVVPTPSYGGSSFFNGPSPYSSFAPQQSSGFSIGPFSVEYGPPSEPFMSFSEPTGSLTSLYGPMSGSGPDDSWRPGPPPPAVSGGSNTEEAWNAPSPGHGPMPNAGHHQSSVLVPPSHPPFGGSKLANLFSSFKLKRSKPKYAIAPKSMHKPPIIIYYGKKPPVHVYQKPEDAVATSGSTVSLAIESPSPSINSGRSSTSNGGNNDNVQTVDISDLSFGASHESEVGVAPAASEPQPVLIPPKPVFIPTKAAIIPAKPVDIFSSTELQPSIYMARNSLNTIFVSDLTGDSPARAIKTYVVRRSEDQDDGQVGRGIAKLSVARATVIAPIAEEKTININNSGSIPVVLAEERISVGQIPQEKKDNDDSRPTAAVLIATVSSEPQEPVKAAESQSIEVVHKSPSSFQTSLSQAEKEAKEAVVSS